LSVSARDVMKLIDAWHPRGCKTEKDLERSLHKHLEKSLPDVDVQKQYASGRVKGDICVDHKVLIELKDGMKSTGQLQRLIGQLDLYASQWKKEVIVVICGDSQRDLVKSVTTKVKSLEPVGFFEEQTIFLVVRGSGAPPKEKSFLSELF
jgi:hypothetical protein